MPIDIAKHVAYWRKGAEEDIETAWILVDKNKRKEALFWAHLSLEKAIKAHVVRDTGDTAPKLHNLLSLVEKSKLVCTEKMLDFFSEMNKYNLRGRYPEMDSEIPTKSHSRAVISETGETVKWLIGKL